MNNLSLNFLKTLFLTLKSGKNLTEGLTLMENFSKQPKERKLYANIRKDIQKGVLFSKAFGDRMSVSSEVVQFIAMAEKGGSFRTMLEKVIQYLEMKDRFYQESNDKIAMPILYFFLSALIVLFVNFYAIPNHTQESLQYSAQIQKLIAGHLAMAQVMGDVLFGILLVVALYFLVVMSAIFSQKRWIQMITKPLALVFPISSKLVRYFEKFILLTLIGEMLQNGISFKRAVLSAANSTDIAEFKNGFKDMLEMVSQGNPQWWDAVIFDKIEQSLLVGAGSMPQVGEVMVQLANQARMNALALGGKFFRLISVLSILLMAMAVFVEFFTVVLTQVLIQKGMISTVGGISGGF